MKNKISPETISRKLGLSISVLWEAVQNEDAEGGKARKEENRPTERKQCGPIDRMFLTMHHPRTRRKGLEVAVLQK